MANPRCPSSFKPAINDTARLLQVLGAPALRILQQAFGGRRVWVPKKGTRLPCIACEERDDCIGQWRRQGSTVASIARHLGVSPKTVYRVLEAAAARSSKRRSNGRA